jgi:hypothetical protein
VSQPTRPAPHVHALSCWCKPQRDLSDLTRLVHTTQQWEGADGVTHVASEITLGGPESHVPYYHERAEA